MEFEEALSLAIIQQSASDYRKAKKELKRLKNKAILEEKELKRKNYCEKEMIQVEKFMLSSWFEILTDLDGKSIFAKLERESDDEKRINRNWQRAT